MTPSAANPSATGTMLAYGESYDFTCNTGYMLASGGTNSTTYMTSFTSTCSSHGEMSGLDEYCIPISCTTELDENAATISSSSGFTYGNSITLTCKEGYRANTGTMSYCINNVSYTGTCGIFSISASESCKRVRCTGLANIKASLAGEMSSTDNYLEYGDEINITCNVHEHILKTYK